MAKNSKAVNDLLNDLSTKLKPGIKKDLVLLREYHRKSVDRELEYYDLAYVWERLCEETFKYNSEKVREYFPLRRVLDSMLQTFSHLFGLSFKKLEGWSLWDPDVELYEISDKDGVRALVFLDLFPRQGKFGHMACFGIQSGHVSRYNSDEYQIPVCGIVGNFNKPMANQASILAHHEIVTMFHEFGHVMHNALSQAKFASQSGTNVALDFVEVPSQMFEEWAWQHELLKKMSGHYKDESKKLSDETIDNIIASKKFMVSYGISVQMTYAIFDQMIHSSSLPEDITGLYASLRKEITGIGTSSDQIFPAGFGHMMGYAGGYYSYIWSQVYAADFWSRFEKEGPFSPSLGESLKKEVLEKGSSIDEMELVKNFLGREPSNKAFLKACGIEE
jgi:Zn-dependent oligopeptidase